MNLQLFSLYVVQNFPIDSANSDNLTNAKFHKFEKLSLFSEAIDSCEFYVT